MTFKNAPFAALGWSQRQKVHRGVSGSLVFAQRDAKRRWVRGRSAGGLGWRASAAGSCTERTRAMEQLKRLLIVVSQGGRLGRKLNRSLTEDHPTYQPQHQRDPVEDVLDQLWRVLTSVKPRPRPLPGYQSAPRGTPEDRQAIGIDCDEVYPGIFVGDM